MSDDDSGKTYVTLKPVPVTDLLEIPCQEVNLETEAGIQFNFKPVLPDAAPAAVSFLPKKKRVCTHLSGPLSSEPVSLHCQWKQCTQQQPIKDLTLFREHVQKHILHVIESDLPLFCSWKACDYETDVESDFKRHVYFHSFHSRIKHIGQTIIKITNALPCQLDANQENVLPDLTEPFRCFWKDCENGEEEILEAEYFYHHVSQHGDECEDEKPRKCGWKGCKHRVATVSKLKEHLRRHSQERTVACPVCGALFANRSKYLDHCSRQNQEGSYKCSYCRKTFASERLLRDHMRTHVMMYRCHICHMTCTSPSALATHIRYKHSEEKPYDCNFCDYKCKSMNDLNAHEDRMHRSDFGEEDDQYPCPYPTCTYTCKSNLTLRIHLDKIHGGVSSQIYRCHMCQKKYSRGSGLSKHLRQQHQFTIPEGHSRVRYRQCDDGLFELQTVRFQGDEDGLIHEEFIYR